MLCIFGNILQKKLEKKRNYESLKIGILKSRRKLKNRDVYVQNLKIRRHI